MKTNERYQGKPLLRLLECYVLDAIGELTSEDGARLTAMQPKLSSVYKRSGTWQQILEAEMDFPSQLREEIIQLWLHNQKIAIDQGVSLSSQNFAEMFVDRNYRHIL